ncbi:uncharacterized protein BDZ99DRAFT_419412 [Mytilinidion resinicola]|uniref:Zn(2)-C6 fungal-type domain-containing protein n=1 Tax=Mytilinidion resinicola TaxID=574789 RepID=A0A6A6YKF8_9PEZI|nr:uncharacterized protein BDZ99DRAFT_419412 [Mytilinidion resinicola]KAF2808367.1 hypothetical protein BDZ99DRAFT_419412 [Mytilinidion resinicola]
MPTSSRLSISAAGDSSWWSIDPSTAPKSSPDAPLAQPSRVPESTEAQPARNAPNVSANRTSVPVACVACRSRHLKCDGGVRCTRCRADGVECSYVKSRRGWKGKRKLKAGESSSNQENGLPVQTPLGSVLGTNSSLASTPAFDFNSEIVPISQIGTPQHGTFGALINTNPFASPPISNQSALHSNLNPNSSVNSGVASTTSAFYFYFYSSHPFLLPHHRQVELLKQRRIPHLELAIQYIGSCFLPAAPTEMYKDALKRMLSQHNLPKDAFSVQTLLLFAIGLHANNDPEKAAQMLDVAINIALEIGLNQGDFALMHGANDRILEECLRRTWWSLYVINGLFAGVNPRIPFRLRDVVTDVPLPCEEVEYYSGHIPFTRSLQDYDDSAFAIEESEFSSFTYLVDAVRIMGKVLEVSRADNMEYHMVDITDADLVNWSLHLPKTKRDMLHNDREVDEILFQAQMIICAATIQLHRPRSNLGFGDVEEVTVCVEPGQILLPTQAREIHTAKCLQAAEDISKLITLPTPLQRHSPFFTCVVVVASVVHLSYWSFLVPDGQDDKIKGLIRLDTGSLQSLSAWWPVANTVLKQVRGVASVMFNSKKSMSIHMWSSIASDDMIRIMIEEGASEDPETFAPLLGQ